MVHDPPGWSESQTIHDLILPRLRDAGWTEAAWEKEFPINPGGRQVIDGRVRQASPLRADIVLKRGDRPIAVVEAKRASRNFRTGVQQARRYAGLLDLPLAYATNGRRITEIDLRAQTEREVMAYRSPAEAWAHYRGAVDLENEWAVAFAQTPYNRQVIDALGRPKRVRYYQDVAVQRLLRRIAHGDDRLLAVMATGAGKTAVALQLVHVLWESRWPRGAGSHDSRPRVLYLADRDILVTQPMRDWFRPAFGSEPVVRVSTSSTRSKHLYFALYQALDQAGEDAVRLFQEYDEDWFDLVIVDECHRGSATADSAWRAVLERFESAVQVGLTATPIAHSQADTYGYFGPPVYEYSLRQGIEDGFIAPFQVIRVHLDSDLDGVTVDDGTSDTITGEPVPARVYRPSELERKLIVPERTEAVARHLTDYLRRTDRMAKTIVFCVDQDHAARFRESMVNLNRDLMQAHGNWAVRITADEGDLGRELLDRFQQPEEAVPVVVTTSRLLSTGVDVPTVKTIVLFSQIKSMPLFKQIIGRGTRVDEEHGKEFFTIVDVTGATRLFADPDFDGPPIRHTEVGPGEELPDEATAPVPVEVVPEDEQGDVVLASPEPHYTPIDGGKVPADIPIDVDDPDEIAGIRLRTRPFTVDGIDVRVAGEGMYIIDPATGNLRLVRFEQWVRDRMMALDRRPDSLLAQWATVRGRRELREALSGELGIGVDDLAQRLDKPDCDPIDLLIHLAWGEPLKTRRDRVQRFTREERTFLERYAAEARQVLAVLLDKYAANGPDDLDARVLVMPPLRDMGTPTDLAARFGGGEQLRSAVDDLGRRLFVA